MSRWVAGGGAGGASAEDVTALDGRLDTLEAADLDARIDTLEGVTPPAAVLTLNGTSDVIVPVDIADGLVIGSNQFDDAGGTDKDNRAFFNKVKGAFRAGTVTGTQWNDANVGAASHASGVNTTASGAHSHAEGNTTTASGNYAHAEGELAVASSNGSHAEGYGTAASGQYSHAEGASVTASGAQAHAEGLGSIASGQYSHAGGAWGVASGIYSKVGGFQAAATRHAQDARSSGLFVTAGDAQANTFVASRNTTDATPTVLTFGGSGSITLTSEYANVLTLPINRAHQFRISAVARRTDVVGTFAGWDMTGLVVRDTGNARLVGTVEGRAWGDAGAASWDVTVSVDTADATNHYLVVTVTGEVAKTIRWVATLTTTEVG